MTPIMSLQNLQQENGTLSMTNDGQYGNEKKMIQ